MAISENDPYNGVEGSGYIGKTNYALGLTATHTTSGDANNINNWNETKRFSGTGGTIDIDLGVSRSLEYFGVNGSLNAVISTSLDDVTYTEATTIACTKVAMAVISATDARYVRMTITGDFSIRVFATGTLDWIQPVQDGYTPAELSRATKYQNEISQEGVFMGRTIVQTAAMFDMEFKDVSENYAYNNMLELHIHLEQYPIFMRWRSTSQPTFAWLDQPASAASYNSLKYLNTTYKMRGITEPL